MRLLEDARQFCSGAALLRQLRQVPKDFLHQLQVVIPNGLQLRLLQPLVGLGCGNSVGEASQAWESWDTKPLILKNPMTTSL